MFAPQFSLFRHGPPQSAASTRLGLDQNAKLPHRSLNA